MVGGGVGLSLPDLSLAFWQLLFAWGQKETFKWLTAKQVTANSPSWLVLEGTKKTEKSWVPELADNST